LKLLPGTCAPDKT